MALRGSSLIKHRTGAAGPHTQTLSGVKFEANFSNKSSFIDHDLPPGRPAGPAGASCCCLG